jgi:MazG family protein
LRPAVIEEAYEVVDAIDSHAPERLRDELGDLLLLILFQAELAREQGAFAIDGVLRGLRDKLIRRHAHVFGEVVAEDAAAVIASWERIKRGEVGQSPSALRDLPAGLPALMRAQTLQKRAAQVGFDWPDLAGPLAKVREETDEVTQAVEAGTPLAIEHEIGDVLFAVVNLARHLQVDAEECLRQACGRFTERFHWVEAAAAAGGRELTRMTLPEMDALWEEAKRNLSQTGVDEEET